MLFSPVWKLLTYIHCTLLYWFPENPFNSAFLQCHKSCVTLFLRIKLCKWTGVTFRIDKRQYRRQLFQHVYPLPKNTELNEFFSTGECFIFRFRWKWICFRRWHARPCEIGQIVFGIMFSVFSVHRPIFFTVQWNWRIDEGTRTESCWIIHNLIITDIPELLRSARGFSFSPVERTFRYFQWSRSLNRGCHLNRFHRRLV